MTASEKLINTLEVIVEQHRHEVIITCAEDCWCWEIDHALAAYEAEKALLQGKVLVDEERLNEIALAADWCPPPQAVDKSKRPVTCQKNNGALPDVCIPCWIAYLQGSDDET